MEVIQITALRRRRRNADDKEDTVMIQSKYEDLSKLLDIPVEVIRRIYEEDIM
jgi:hypothetical protein